MWSLRERVAETFRMEDEYAITYDVSLPINNYYTFTEQARKDLANITIRTIGFGHLGDGNLHITVFVKNHTSKIEQHVNEYIYNKVKELNGSISAEHGLGFFKAKYLKNIKTEGTYNLMIDIKRLMDPNGILNPYKVLSSF